VAAARGISYQGASTNYLFCLRSPFPDKILLIVAITAKKPPADVSQLGELKIKVHLPIKCSWQMLTNPDKVITLSSEILLA